MVGKFILAFSLLLFGPLAHSETLFEGYYKVMLSGQHVGYYIMKQEYNDKKKQFTATTFLKIKGEKGEDQESVKAIAAENFHPISYSYTSISGGKTRTIDAQFTKGQMSGVIVNDGKSEKISRKVDPNSFLSTFLIYTILRSPQGLKPKTNFGYTAIAEETGQEAKGAIDIKDYETFEGLKVLRVKNNFVDTEAHCMVSEKGEVISISQPAQKTALELVGQPSAATADLKVPSSTLKTLFGEVPTGQKNLFAQMRHEEPVAKAPVKIPEGAGKQQGVPGGKGIQLKVNKGDGKTQESK